MTYPPVSPDCYRPATDSPTAPFLDYAPFVNSAEGRSHVCPQRLGQQEQKTAAYLKYLYTPEGQEIAGKHYYRPRDPAVAAKYASRFSPVKLLTIDDFGGWAKAQATHFGNGGVFDQIYLPQ